MSESTDLQSVVIAAERAATAGDYASAERLLREAARLQETSLGPLHPDLANTLNNLGIVCEITNKPEDAEDFYRRACAIAAEALPTDHPFVATSRKNLVDFCAARGKAVDRPAPASPVAPPTVASAPLAPRPVGPPPVAPTPTRSEVRSPARPERPTPPVQDPPLRVAADARTGFRPIGALVAGVVLVAIIAAVMLWRSNDQAAPPGDSSASPPAASGKPVPPRPDPPRAAPSGSEPSAATPRKAERPTKPESRSTTPARQSPVVVDARICRELSTGAGDWRCAGLSGPVNAGMLYYYTRLKSPTDAKVHHRWYHGNQLRQSVELTVRANPSAGYRTFSRNTVHGSGDWRVELRASDGTVLHEERFVVR